MPKFEQYSAHVKCDGRKLTEYEYADETDSDEIEEVDPGERISKKDKGKGRATEQHEHEHKANERNEDEEMENATQVEESEEMEEEKKSSPYDNPKDDKIVWIESKTGKTFTVTGSIPRRRTSDLVVDLWCDGVRIDTQHFPPKDPATQYIFKGIPTVVGKKQRIDEMVFQALSLTDDPRVGLREVHGGLGSIIVFISNVVMDNSVRVPLKLGKPDSGTFHEQSKPPTTHSVGVGNYVLTEQDKISTFRYIPNGCICIFEFLYRSIDVLRANGVVPEPRPTRSRTQRHHAHEDLNVNEEINEFNEDEDPGRLMGKNPDSLHSTGMGNSADSTVMRRLPSSDFPKQEQAERLDDQNLAALPNQSVGTKYEIMAGVEMEAEGEYKSETKPKVKKEVKPEIEMQIMVEIELEIELETKQTIKPKVKPGIKRGIKPDIKQEVKPDIKQEIGPDINPEVGTEANREIKTEIKAEEHIQDKEKYQRLRKLRREVKALEEELRPRKRVKREADADVIMISDSEA